MEFTSPQPYTLAISDEVLDDLRSRLDRVRWPAGEIPGSEWDYGASLAYMKELVEYWRTEYDWREHEREINSWSQFQMTIGGQRIHFIHERGRGPTPLPLMLIHGWPGSFYEFMQVLGPLTDPAAYGGDPADAFDLVVPSLPGYGLSAPTAERQVNICRMAELFTTLMQEGLGYTRYGTQGGDWGSMVASRLGFINPRQVVGVHLNMVGVAPHPADRENLSEAERVFQTDMRTWQREEAGYQGIQGTKPQTLAFGLNDSPVGLCAWIVEKFRSWSDCDGQPENVYTKDQLLTNVMLYWLSQNIHSSTRLYYEERHHPWRLGKGEKITVPTALAVFPKEIVCPPREWAERAYNVQRWTHMPEGGHFAAMEQPGLLVDDVREFFRGLR